MQVPYKGESRKERKVNGKKDIISHRICSLAGDIDESLRHLEYHIPGTMTNGFMSG